MKKILVIVSLTLIVLLVGCQDDQSMTPTTETHTEVNTVAPTTAEQAPTTEQVTTTEETTSEVVPNEYLGDFTYIGLNFDYSQYTIYTEKVSDGRLYYLTKDNEIQAMVYFLTSEGYSDDIEMYIAIDDDYSVLDYMVTYHDETEGIGSKIVDFDFNYTNARMVSDFDGLSGATVSSNAVEDIFEMVSLRVENDFFTDFGSLDLIYGDNNLAEDYEFDGLDAIKSLFNVQITMEPHESDIKSKVYTNFTGEDDIGLFLEGAYKIYNNMEEHIAYAYMIQSFGFNGLVEVAYVLDVSDNTLLGVVPGDHNETISFDDRYYNLLDDTFFNQFRDIEILVASNIDTIAGATYSSFAYIIAYEFAKDIFVDDQNIDLTNVFSGFDIENMTYNNDLSTIDDYMLVVELSFYGGSKHSFVGVNNNYDFVRVIAGDRLNTSEQAYLSNQLSEEQSIAYLITLVDYKPTSKSIQVRVDGFTKQSINLEIILNDALSSVEEINLLSTNESYDATYNGNYEGEQTPFVEESYLNNYLNNNLILDSVGGATVTSQAMMTVLNWINQLLSTSVN
ncbi:MAG TPA: FMN-binding protein [Candidatus Izemoplasmatales bacterium]|nr:FMN-binding protein [Candidatus Izemoplasmatales bacterium]